MNIPELNERIDTLRSRREELHDMLHEVLADDGMTVAERKEKEGAARMAIREINEECYPLELVRGKLNQLMQGKPLSEQAQAEFDRCSEIVGEITLT